MLVALTVSQKLVIPSDPVSAFMLNSYYKEIIPKVREESKDVH